MDQEIATRATHLHSLCGLSMTRLASVFGVSRQTYYNWEHGERPHEAKRLHFFAVVTCMDEAAERFPDPAAFCHWLLTPVSPGGKIPLELLQAQQYSAFRGFLLRQNVRQWPRPLFSERERVMEQEFGHLTWREEALDGN